MKKIEAFIKAHRLDDVTLALHHVEGLTGMTVSEARGFGRGRGAEHNPDDFHQVVRIEVFCADALADKVVQTIEHAGHTGLRGDGKVYVLPVEQAVRISSGERGEVAV
ncbi:P-II family nitrogen regulator [Planctomycetales bacterium ZRK34]|nr:P-II family nitrogen regulator [Planctomycetales bacterium ZRK34]